MQASRDYSNSVGSVEIAAVKSNIDLSMERHGGQANRLSETISQLYKRLNFVLHNGGAEAQANKADKPCSSAPLVKFIDDSTDELEHQCNRLDDILSRLPT